jgi:hypothetical protein
MGRDSPLVVVLGVLGVLGVLVLAALIAGTGLTTKGVSVTLIPLFSTVFSGLATSGQYWVFLTYP